MADKPIYECFTCHTDIKPANVKLHLDKGHEVNKYLTWEDWVREAKGEKDNENI